jgi:chromosome segregation ATPase
MTNIFSSKKEVSELKADKETLIKNVSELTQQLDQAKNLTQEFAAFKEKFGKEKAEYESVIETMKSEFNTAVESLKNQLADITKQKTEVEQTAKVEVETVKESVKSQIMEGVAVKVASMGVTEAELPKVPQNELAERFRIVRTVNPANQ